MSKVPEDAEPPKENQIGLLHAALVVGSEEELLEMHRHLKEQGVTIEAIFDHGFTHSLYLYDPDGNALEIYSEVPGYDWRVNNDFIGYLKPLNLEASAS